MTWNIDPDYIDVAERIRLFYEQFPDGRLQTDRPWVEAVGESVFVCCVAHAYRTADDQAPSTGVAWEPVPGPTPFTKDSELMNAQTSAWGRAIVAAGIPSKKIATAEDVQARREYDPHAEAIRARGGNAKMDAPADETRTDKQNRFRRTAEQNKYLHKLIGDMEKSGVPPPNNEPDWKAYCRTWIKTQFGKESSKDLTKAEAGLLIDHLDPPF